MTIAALASRKSQETATKVICFVQRLHLARFARCGFASCFLASFLPNVLQSREQNSSKQTTIKRAFAELLANWTHLRRAARVSPPKLFESRGRRFILYSPLLRVSGAKTDNSEMNRNEHSARKIDEIALFANYAKLPSNPSNKQLSLVLLFLFGFAPLCLFALFCALHLRTD